MYEYFLGILTFCVVLFMYLHIIYHLKTSNDLEIYTIDSPSKDKLEEICNIRQPVVFDMYNNQFKVLVLGGGYSPSGNQLSLESNVKYFRKVQNAIGLGNTSTQVYFADGKEKGRD